MARSPPQAPYKRAAGDRKFYTTFRARTVLHAPPEATQKSLLPLPLPLPLLLLLHARVRAPRASDSTGPRRPMFATVLPRLNMPNMLKKNMSLCMMKT